MTIKVTYTFGSRDAATDFMIHIAMVIREEEALRQRFAKDHDRAYRPATWWPIEDPRIQEDNDLDKLQEDLKDEPMTVYRVGGNGVPYIAVRGENDIFHIRKGSTVEITLGDMNVKVRVTSIHPGGDYALTREPYIRFELPSDTPSKIRNRVLGYLDDTMIEVASVCRTPIQEEDTLDVLDNEHMTDVVGYWGDYLGTLDNPKEEASVENFAKFMFFQCNPLPGELPLGVAIEIGQQPPRSMEELAREAIEIQDACNGGGMIRKFKQVAIELRAHGILNTADFNTHPIIRMWVSKLHSLCLLGLSDTNTYGEAYHWCQQVVDGGDSAYSAKEK